MSMTSKIKKHPKCKGEKRKNNQLSGFEKSHTQQNSRDAVCINKLMAKYRKTGMLDHVNTYQGNYGDFTTHTDFAESMNKVVKANQAFDQLPSELRKRFNNDTADFLEFVHDPKNIDEMVDLGLAVKPRQEPVTKDVKPVETPVKEVKKEAKAD